MTVMRSNDALEQLDKLVECIKTPNWIKNVKLDYGWMPLHLTASVGNTAIAQYLLVDCGLNPLALSCDDKLALDIALDGEADNEFCWMLLQHMKKRAFSDHTATLLTSKETSVDS